MEMVRQISRGRVVVGRGTLYTLLGKLKVSKIIKETKDDGRKV